MSMSIQEISDRMEIEQLLARYCHAIDKRDWDAYRAVYTPDAVIDDGTAGPGNSVEDMVTFLSRVLERVPSPSTPSPRASSTSPATPRTPGPSASAPR